MVFSSTVFLIYFLPAFLLLYYLSPQKLKNWVILLSSIFFYSWGAPKFIFVIIGTTLLDFFLVKWMDKSGGVVKRKILLTISVSMNLGLLFYFKYSNFFIENINSALFSLGFSEIYWTKLILPIGISFYTFETMTYVVDVYRKIHKPLTNFWEYQLYIILFPKLIAGPIIRYHEISAQITNRSENETIDNRISGFFRFVTGLAKKVLIANVVGFEADIIFQKSPGDISSLVAWYGIFAYTFQIYFDFSGYSDMAIGLAKMIGFKFPENFNNPYISQSITEFWRRWHITLGVWMRNYLYIPLGGNKVQSKKRLYFNLWFVFLASGLWHGASWNFVIWGAFHGFFLVIERAGFKHFYEWIGKIPSVIITFFIVLHGWIFFRMPDFNSAAAYLNKMYSFEFTGPDPFFKPEFYSALIVAAFFSFFALPKFGMDIQNKLFFFPLSTKQVYGFGLIFIVLFVFSLSTITTSGFNPFIYFRF